MPLPVTYKDNKSAVMDRGDYGIKISKAGYDATTAADNDLLFNSSWPSVQIVKVKNVNGAAVVPHGLLFPPVAFILSGSSPNFDSVMYGQNVDDTNVYVSTQGTLVIYNIDISTDVEYPYNIRPSVNVRYDPDYGIKVPKLGKDITSTDLRDFVLHSRCGSPLILAVKTQQTSNPSNPDVVQYTSRLGYATLNFGYAGIAQGTTHFPTGAIYGKKAYQFAPQGGSTAPVAFTDGFTTYVQMISTSDSRASVVCLRSPVFAPTNSVQVTY